jgi:Flp pilus assembly secretin CpaC
MRAHLGVFKRSLIVAAIACLGLSAGGATAADETIDVTIDFAKLLQLDRPAKTVVIGNPSIADASVADPARDTLLLTGKTAGTTNLIVLDDDRKEIIQATLRVSSDIRQLTTVFYGAHRQTFSCAPVCEQVISVGDDPAKFDVAKDQIQSRQQFATGQ